MSMKCHLCGQVFGEGINCQNCGADRVAGLGAFHGYHPDGKNGMRTIGDQTLESRNNTILCFHCGEVIPEDSNYCPYCSSSLYVSCPQCSFRYQVRYPACPQCGTNREAYKKREQERRAAEEKQRQEEAKRRQELVAKQQEEARTRLMKEEEERKNAEQKRLIKEQQKLDLIAAQKKWMLSYIKDSYGYLASIAEDVKKYNKQVRDYNARIPQREKTIVVAYVVTLIISALGGIISIAANEYLGYPGYCIGLFGSAIVGLIISLILYFGFPNKPKPYKRVQTILHQTIGYAYGNTKAGNGQTFLISPDDCFDSFVKLKELEGAVKNMVYSYMQKMINGITQSQTGFAALPYAQKKRLLLDYLFNHQIVNSSAHAVIEAIIEDSIYWESSCCISKDNISARINKEFQKSIVS